MNIQQDDILIGTLSIAGKPVYVSEQYQGPYEVIPKPWVDQYLDTDNKMMAQDVRVFEIPYYEVSNISGKTVIIGD